MGIWDSLVAQMVKHLPAMWGTWVQSLGQEDPLEKEMAAHSSIAAWKIPWTEEPGRLQSEPRGFSRVTAGFSSYDGEFRLPLVLAQASPIFHSSCEGKLGIALE